MKTINPIEVKSLYGTLHPNFVEWAEQNDIVYTTESTENGERFIIDFIDITIIKTDDDYLKELQVIVYQFGEDYSQIILESL